MKYFEALLSRKAEGSPQSAASPEVPKRGTDITAKSPESSPEDPSGGFVSAGREHLASHESDPPLPEWPQIGVDVGLNDPPDWRIEAFEERAAIMEFDGRLPRDEAERRADPTLADYFQPTNLLD